MREKLSLNNIWPPGSAIFSFSQFCNQIICRNIRVRVEACSVGHVGRYYCLSGEFHMWKYVDKRPRLAETESYPGFICSGKSSDNYSLFTLKIKIRKIILKTCN